MSRRDLARYLDDFGWHDVAMKTPTAAQPPSTGDEPRSTRATVPTPARDTSPTAARGTVPTPARDTAVARARVAEPAFEPPDQSGAALTAPTLAEMAPLVASCRKCRLCEKRNHVVFGVGAANARLMFIGEGPGAEEDRQGEPFVGRAGQLLTAMIRALGLSRSEVYIANIVKCRPPGNRDPEVDEAAACLPYLRRQIELIDPAVLVLLGRIAARFLLNTTAPISSYRGRWRSWEGRAVMPTFHPAYLLRTPSAKAQSWSDLRQVRARLDPAGTTDASPRP